MNSDQFFFAIFGLDSVSSRLKNKDLIQNEIFGGVACNGSGLCEVAENRSRKFRFRRNVAKANFYLLIYEKKPIKLAFAD